MNIYGIDKKLIWIDLRVENFKDTALRSSRSELFCLPQACNFIKKDTLAQMFLCDFCQMFKNTLFIEHLWRMLLYIPFSLWLWNSKRMAKHICCLSTWFLIATLVFQLFHKMIIITMCWGLVSTSCFVLNSFLSHV